MHPVGNLEVFTEQYTALSRHYGFSSTKTQPHCPHEKGDVEQGHYRLKKTLDFELGLGEILQILSITLFEQVPLSEILMKTESQNEEFEFHNQLSLFDL